MHPWVSHWKEIRMSLASRAEKPYPIPYFNVCDSLVFPSAPLDHYRGKWLGIWDPKSGGAPPSLWKYIHSKKQGQHHAVYCINLVVSAKKDKISWDYGKKYWYPAPFCFNFSSFYPEGCEGKIYSCLEWTGGSDRNHTMVSNCPYSTRQSSWQSENILAVQKSYFTLLVFE